MIPDMRTVPAAMGRYDARREIELASELTPWRSASCRTAWRGPGEALEPAGAADVRWRSKRVTLPAAGGEALAIR